MGVIKVGIIDYQSGNMRSVTNALEYAGGTAIAIRTPDDFVHCSHIVLPGVGAFGFCIARLRTSGLLPALEDWALAERKPILGICVGMQLMADQSDEQGCHRGLGWIGGSVRRLDPKGDRSIHVPHVGWNEVQFRESFGLFREGDRPNFYFDHSFAYQASSTVEVGTCCHGQNFAAVIRRENMIAVQFHPEKSQSSGMRLLQSFFAL